MTCYVERVRDVLKQWVIVVEKPLPVPLHTVTNLHVTVTTSTGGAPDHPVNDHALPEWF